MYLDKIFFGNTVKQWAIALFVFVVILLGLRIIKSLIYRRLDKLAQKTRNDLDDLVVDLIDKIKFFFLFLLSIYFASQVLTLADKVTGILSKIIIIALLLQTAIWGTGVIKFWIERYKKRKLAVDAASVTTFSALGFILQLILWAIILLLAMDNMGVNITTLVAGLGVGGIAVALAVQNILGDLFASLSIVLDKPFVIGDFIIVDSYLGSIEHIGLKTTRVRSLSGEQLVFANSDLLKSRIRNYKRMFERRVVFSFGVIYQTTYEQLEMIPRLVKDIITSQEKVRFDRAHFKEYGDSSLNFEVVYWVLEPDYNLYMDIQQAINLEIYKEFQAEGIDFAYPTRTLYFNDETASTTPEEKKEESEQKK